jgi:hypothetical protein
MTAMDSGGFHGKMRADNNMAEGGRHSVSLKDLAHAGMLPTPQAGLEKHSGKEDYWNNRMEKGRQMDLHMKLLIEAQNYMPTPTVNDSKNSTLPPSQIDRVDSLATRALKIGATGHLNPRFVEWMMGYPTGWLLSDT